MLVSGTRKEKDVHHICGDIKKLSWVKTFSNIRLFYSGALGSVRVSKGSYYYVLRIGAM